MYELALFSCGGVSLILCDCFLISLLITTGILGTLHTLCKRNIGSDEDILIFAALVLITLVYMCVTQDNIKCMWNRQTEFCVIFVVDILFMGIFLWITHHADSYNDSMKAGTEAEEQNKISEGK